MRQEMLFNFRLFPFSDLISEIHARESPLTEVSHHQVSWYNLTDGWYWIEVRERSLFRYTKEVGEHIQFPRSANGLFVDYYVSRLWQDLLEILPAILEPLPVSLAERLTVTSDWNDWIADLDEMWDVSNKDSDEELVDEEEGVYFHQAAALWWHERRLDTSYLISGPNIWFWNDGTFLHIAWDNRHRLLEKLPAWEATTGQISFPVADFLGEIIAFDQQLMVAMADRVKAAPTYWTDPQFIYDLRDLQAEHQQRATWLQTTLQKMRKRTPTNWQEILTSIMLIEKNTLFIDIHKKS